MQQRQPQHRVHLQGGFVGRRGGAVRTRAEQLRVVGGVDGGQGGAPELHVTQHERIPQAFEPIPKRRCRRRRRGCARCAGCRCRAAFGLLGRVGRLTLAGSRGALCEKHQVSARYVRAESGAAAALWPPGDRCNERRDGAVARRLLLLLLLLLLLQVRGDARLAQPQPHARLRVHQLEGRKEASKGHLGLARQEVL